METIKELKEKIEELRKKTRNKHVSMWKLWEGKRDIELIKNLDRICLLNKILFQTEQIMEVVKGLKRPKDEEAPYTGEWAMGVNEVCDDIIMRIKGEKIK